MMLTVWDLESGKKLNQTPAHAGDVCSMSLKVEQNIIVTGSVDRSIKLWDVRTLKCTQTFFGHDADVNSVCVSWTLSISSFELRNYRFFVSTRQFHPSGQAFVSASEDKTARLFDIRSDQQVKKLMMEFVSSVSIKKLCSNRCACTVPRPPIPAWLAADCLNLAVFC